MIEMPLVSENFCSFSEKKDTIPDLELGKQIIVRS